ncbi:hypothetical protein BDF21DRAFT_396040 [Thamnidium elegans]|uniref:F-box domain-containing protein n=1 Tax=Thamnidium elegans TaxID=101142 RepID=A0A8H7VY12_9FUNG|nr:hypothetical protein INT48_002356 [Thamnidium elegans]KAI8090594.1 hypothetical protein BDF21DRAFT_396040 [Thamnidium elegans]
MATIHKLNDDCLELIFEACQGCPWTLCTLTKVCRQWYIISHRPSVWRRLLMDKPNFHAAYTRFLLSEYNFERLQAVRTVTLSKPSETRHAHLRPLPFFSMTQIRNLYTSNLCLAEIEYLSQQIVATKSELNLLSCINIETWCDTKRFSSDLIQAHPYLNHVQFQFSQDGHSGFASIHNRAVLQLERWPPSIKVFSLTSVRDSESIEQRNMLVTLADIENDRDEVYYQHEIEQIEQKKNIILQGWYYLEKALIDKYKFFSSLNGLERLEFGFCYAWTPDVWRHCFGKVIRASPDLYYLSLHGWDQLGKLTKMGGHSSTIQPIRADAEKAIHDCFEMIPHLTCLQLVDFSIGSGLFNIGNHLSKSIQHLEIEFTKTFARYFTESADLWLLIGPLKEFISSVFSTHMPIKRSVTIRLDSDLLNQVENSSFFAQEPFLQSIKLSLADKNVEIILLDSCII